MSSVITLWSGRLCDRRSREELIALLGEFAEVSHQRIEDRTARRLQAVGAMSDRSEPNIRYFDHSVETGRIAIGRSLLLVDQLAPGVKAMAIPIDPVDGWQLDDSVLSCALGASDSEAWYRIAVPPIRLSGIAFRLFDPRGRFLGDDWMNFVFVDASGFPPLDGQLVRVMDHRECAAMLSSEWIKKADWCVETSSLPMQGYLEEWFDLFMTWIKVFFIPDLDYWRYESLNQYERLKGSIDRLIASDGSEVAKQAVLEYLIEEFQREADEWEKAWDES